jgi:hypothetical protein
LASGQTNTGLSFLFVLKLGLSLETRKKENTGA